MYSNLSLNDNFTENCMGRCKDTAHQGQMDIVVWSAGDLE